MGEGACKGTKGWTFNKKSSFFFKKNHFNPQNLNEDPKQEKIGASQSLWIEGTPKTVWVTLNTSVDPEGHITFFKYDCH